VRRIATFFALPAGDRTLLLRAFVTVAAVRISLQLFAIGRLRAWAGRIGVGTRPVDRIVWAVRVASRWLPGTTCLASAFALQRRLSAEGHASDLHIGVALENETFAAHAWLSCEGRILVGELDHDRYTPLVAWQVVDLPRHVAAGKSDPV
jgi:hypothetical protein